MRWRLFMKLNFLKVLNSLVWLVPERIWRVMIQLSASRLNIVGVSALGDYGVLSSAPNDKVILATYAKTGKWAEGTNLAIKDFFKEGLGTYLDIGANIGMTVVPIASTSNVQCFAFEPEPTNFRNLETNIAVNCRNKNVKTYNIALFDRNSCLPFEISQSNLGDHRIRLGKNLPGVLAENKRTVVDVRCMRLDDMNIPINGPLFVK